MIENEDLKTINEENPISVLSIEDDDILSDCLKVIFRDSNISLTSVKNVEEGLSFLHTNEPNVILLDMMLGGGMDGFDCLTFLKKNIKFQHIPVIILSSHTHGDNIRKGLALGANDWIPKPFKSEELILKIVNITYKMRKTINYSNNKEISSLISDFDNDYKLAMEFAKYVAENINCGINIKEKSVAQKLHTTYTKLDHVVKKYYKMQPVKYILIQRLKKADLMIKNSNMSINDIAYNSGFNTVTYFCSVYKLHFGITPLNSRNSVQAF